MNPTAEVQIGRHDVAMYEHALVRITWVGDVSDDEAQRARDVFIGATAALRSTWITDLSRLGKMSVRARIILACRDVPVPVPRNIALIYVCANLRTKIVMSLITAAAALTSREIVTTHFFDTADDAMSFARTLIAQLSSSAPAGA